MNEREETRLEEERMKALEQKNAELAVELRNFLKRFDDLSHLPDEVFNKLRGLSERFCRIENYIQQIRSGCRAIRDLRNFMDGINRDALEALDVLGESMAPRGCPHTGSPYFISNGIKRCSVCSKEIEA